MDASLNVCSTGKEKQDRLSPPSSKTAFVTKGLWCHLALNGKGHAFSGFHSGHKTHKTLLSGGLQVVSNLGQLQGFQARNVQR